jgi:hypothetical protein
MIYRKNYLKIPGIPRLEDIVQNMLLEACLIVIINWKLP